MTAIYLLIGAGIDAVFGEPKSIWTRVPHPAVLMGQMVGRLDETLNQGPNKRLNGVFAMCLLVFAFGLLGLVLTRLPFGLAEIIVVAVLLAQKSLVDHVMDVARAILRSTEDGRKSVAMIVGRDTAQMENEHIARAAIESGAENFSDGVIAPAFWFLIFGLPGLLIYKITNTADSMIGYKTEKYRDFGWAAARLDDVLNWIPARISAALILLSSPSDVHIKPLIKDARKHRSPNAGWPESAMARVLNVALAGPRSYDGQMQEFPFVNPDGRRNVAAEDIRQSVGVLWKSWGIGLFIVALSVFVI